MDDAPQPAAGTQPEWTTQAADTVEQVVAAVRDRTVVPAQRATRAIVFGFLAAFFVVPAVLLLLVATFRLVDNYLPGEVWAAWVLFGGIFVVAGAFLWVRKER